MSRASELVYDVCLSFAGEDRAYVEATADQLRRSGVRVFYDLYEEADLWGKDLYQHLDAVYRTRARYCVVFISQWYARKLWTRHELRSAQARAFQENQEYILPARFDDTEIPGLPGTVGYVSLAVHSPRQLAELVARKIGRHPEVGSGALAKAEPPRAAPEAADRPRSTNTLKRVPLIRATLRRG